MALTNTSLLMKTWFLYLIECADGSIYTGITVDVVARYAAHCQGNGARYTRSHPPLRLLGWETHPDRSAASKAEFSIKRLTPAGKRRYAATLTQISLEKSAITELLASTSL
jgi:putative endonuclease